MSTPLQLSWTQESEHEGNFLQIEPTKIRLDRYSLPSTKWSGGSSSRYRFEELYVGSSLYKTIVAIFDENTAKAALKAVEHRDEHPKLSRYNKAFKRIEMWLDKLENNNSIEKLWNESEDVSYFYGDDDVALNNAGLRREQREELSYSFIDIETNKEVYLGHPRSTIYFMEKNGIWRTFMFNNWHYVICHNVLGELLIDKPFLEIEKDMRIIDAEYRSVRLESDLQLIYLKMHRINLDMGSYIVIVQPNSGKMMKQKIN